VRHIVVVDPGDRAANRHLRRRRGKAEVVHVDDDRVFACAHEVSHRFVRVISDVNRVECAGAIAETQFNANHELMPGVEFTSRSRARSLSMSSGLVNDELPQ
jgi:hypothetical protein